MEKAAGWRGAWSCPPLVDDWGSLLVARDWLLDRGLESEMWQEVHALRLVQPTHVR